MKPLRSTLAVFVAAFALVASAAAADISGTWKWTFEGRNGTIESTAHLQLKDGVLTGTVSGRNGDTAIGDASFADNHVAFSVTREFNGNSFTVKYDGKLDGDSITGTMTRPNRDSGTVTSDWKATRAN